MKTKVIVLSFSVLLVVSQIANAQADKKVLVAVGTEVCQAIDPGQWTTLPSGNVKVRGLRNKCIDTIPNPEPPFLPSVTGFSIFNCNLDKSMGGPCWGTFTTPGEEPDTLLWEGVSEGNINFLTGVGTFKTKGHGSGPNEGLRFEAEQVWDGTGGPAVFTIKIFNPKGW